MGGKISWGGGSKVRGFMVVFQVNTVVVYGPQGCGKSVRSAELMARFGCTRVQDDWDEVSFDACVACS